ncbi:MAG: DUF2809 domain-containing protein [Planctomycetaceae bacterium]|nr:DUF2809 domain-containing protein [Planctomycetaceae bacterium]
MIEATTLRRNRLLYLAAMAMVILLGLASRTMPGLSPSFRGKYPGDALWALMVFLLIGALLPALSTYRTALLALAIAFTIEFSQLYQAPWINTIRQATLGHLVLGSRFHRFDLVAYVVGVAIGAIVELFVRQHATKAPGQSDG